MSIARDHEERLTQFFRDNPDIRNALKSDQDTIDHGASSRRDWEEWVETTSKEQVALLREKARKSAIQATRKRKQARLRYVFLSVAVTLIVFLSVVPTGRAFANAAMHNVTSLVNQFFYMQSESVNEANEANEANEGKETAGSSLIQLTDMDKIKQASQYLGEPLLYIGKPGIAVSNVSVNRMESTDIINIEYTVSDNDSIITRQNITKNQAGWGAAFDTGGEAPKTHVLYNGEILYYTYTHEGYAIGMAHWGDTSFTISSTTLKWETLLEYVDALALVK